MAARSRLAAGRAWRQGDEREQESASNPDGADGLPGRMHRSPLARRLPLNRQRVGSMVISSFTFAATPANMPKSTRLTATDAPTSLPGGIRA